MSAAKLTFTPLYAQIKASILSRIAAGEWTPGAFLPSEFTLAEEYGVSQGTLRKALNELTLEKRLVRFQGKGTAVAVLDADSALFPFFMLHDARDHRVYPSSRTRSIDHDTAGEGEAAALGIPAGSGVIRIHRIRVLDDEPVIHEQVVLPERLFPRFSLDLNRLPNTLYEYYHQKFGILVVRATECLEAVSPDALDRKYLGVEPCKPLLEVRRTAFDTSGCAVEFRRSRVNTQRHHYRIELR
ncbi:MAG: GntR family transcriptional regulator [Desulfovibrionaceae bacterium]|nr:GntR family transcriptional regulator [Desulfovibrionaceae bacterium]